MTVSRLIYVSTVRQPVKKGLVEEILDTARRRNAEAGITGLLLFDGLHFMQLLEGEEHAVSDVFHKIGQDPRHRNVIRIAQEARARRQFPEWAMGYREVDGQVPADQTAWFALTNAALNAYLHPQVDPDVRMIFTSFAGFQPAMA